MNEEPIIIDRDGAIAVLRINRPKTLNALDSATLARLEASFDGLVADGDVRVIVLTGEGDRAFVAGGDINDLNSRMGLSHYLTLAENLHRVFNKIETCDKPVIAAVNGWALGGGTELLLATDIRLVADTAKLGLPEITLGLFPGAGGTQRLMRQIAPCRARELMFTGDQMTAQEAHALGLVNRVVPKDQLMAAAMEMARRIALKSPLVLKLLKRTLRIGAEMPQSAALSYEQSMIGLVLDSDDSHEGCGAFIEKRTPTFTGR